MSPLRLFLRRALHGSRTRSTRTRTTTTTITSTSTSPLRTPLHQHPARLSSTTTSNTTKRINALLTRLPSFLHPYTTALRTAPISHITSFLILHEITVVVPLVGLAATFHYAGWLPERWVQGRWARESVERFGRWFARRGWFGVERVGGGAEGGSRDADGGSRVAEGTLNASSLNENENESGSKPGTGNISNATTPRHPQEPTKWQANEAGTRILLEVATAYALVKVLLPARIWLSVWAAPWFARAVLGRFGRLGGLFRGAGRADRGRGVQIRSGAAGTGATGGGVIGMGKGRGKDGA